VRLQKLEPVAKNVQKSLAKGEHMRKSILPSKMCVEFGKRKTLQRFEPPETQF